MRSNKSFRNRKQAATDLPISLTGQTKSQLSPFAILASQLSEEDGDVGVKLSVLSQLAKLAEATENKRAIVLDKITYPRLLAFADPEQPIVLRRQAIRALAALCSESLNQEQLWEHARSLILAATQKTESTDFNSYSLRRHAYWALINVSTDSPLVQEQMWADSADTEKSVATPSTREVVLAACAQEEGEEEEIRVQALWILSNLACLVANKALIWNDERTRAILLTSAAESSPEAVRIQAVRALAGLAYDGGFRDASERPQLTPRRRDVLLECASEQRSDPLRREATRALRILGMAAATAPKPEAAPDAAETAALMTSCEPDTQAAMEATPESPRDQREPETAAAALIADPQPHAWAAMLSSDGSGDVQL